jgi:hypothetical protein
MKKRKKKSRELDEGCWMEKCCSVFWGEGGMLQANLMLLIKSYNAKIISLQRF